MKSRSVVLVVITVFLSAVAAYAHHSFAGSYIEDKLVTFEGTVVEFSIRNPHSFVVFEVTGKDGTKKKWGGEWGGASQLSQGGVSRTTLVFGDKVTVDGAPARDPAELKVLVRKIVRPASGARAEYVWPRAGTNERVQ